MTSREKVLVTVFVGFVGGLVALGAITGTSQDPQAAAQPSKPPVFDRSTQMQAQRQELVQKLTDQGYIRNIRITAQGTPVVTVSNGFIAADFALKQNITSAIYAMHFDGTNPKAQVRVVSAQTGKQVGFFMIDIGLQIQ